MTLAVAENETGITTRERGSSRLAIGQRGIEPATAGELWQIAERVAASGMAPKGMEKPETVFVALEMGLELGMPMMMALRSIAVINGRPAIWGDAALALVRASGLMDGIREWFEVDGKRLTVTIDGKEHPRTPTPDEIKKDSCAAVTFVRRVNDPDALVYSFSIGDAKAASLWGKAGPWSQYPARMLKFRSRGFALRDKFGDVLQGMATSEEAGDIVQGATVVTSTTTSEPSKLDALRAPKLIPHPTDEKRTIDTSDAQAEPPKAPAAPDVVTPQAVEDQQQGGGETFDLGNDEHFQVAMSEAYESATGGTGEDFAPIWKKILLANPVNAGPLSRRKALRENLVKAMYANRIDADGRIKNG